MITDMIGLIDDSKKKSKFFKNVPSILKLVFKITLHRNLNPF